MRSLAFAGRSNLRARSDARRRRDSPGTARGACGVPPPRRMESAARSCATGGWGRVFNDKLDPSVGPRLRRRASARPCPSSGGRLVGGTWGPVAPTRGPRSWHNQGAWRSRRLPRARRCRSARPRRNPTRRAPPLSGKPLRSSGPPRYGRVHTIVFSGPGGALTPRGLAHTC